MARIRTIKPEFFEDEDLPKVSALARVAFIGLWTRADRAGRLEDKPGKLRVQLFPWEPATDMDALLSELAREHFIIRYEVDGKALIQVRTFEEHQRPHPKEPASRLPPPPSAASREKPRQAADASGMHETVERNGSTQQDTADHGSPRLATDTSGMNDDPAVKSRVGREGDLAPAREGLSPNGSPRRPERPSIAAAGSLPSEHLDHVHCWFDRGMCVPRVLHEELVKRLGGDRQEASDRLRAWYPTVVADFPADRPLPSADRFKFWVARYAEWQRRAVSTDDGDARAAAAAASADAVLARYAQPPARRVS